MEARTKTEEEITAHKPLMLFGKDLMEIPCFRKSFICGICCGVAGGLACFLGTSKTLFSTHFAFASLWVGVFAYWIPCRYKYETSHLQMAAIKRKVKTKRNIVLVKADENQNQNSETETEKL